MNEEQEKLVEEFGEICKSKGIDADLIIMAGTIAFGDYAVDNGKEEEIMKDLIKFVKNVKEKGNQEFFEYMYETYVSKMPDQTVYNSADSDKEDSIE